ncbi:hypothetical protein ACM66B_005343 [Microbotryomycetes sp. NB124-2]
MSRRQSNRRRSTRADDELASGEFALLPAELQLVSSLTAQQRLLVVQAVHELGNQDWDGVAELLKGHKLMLAARPGGASAKEAFTTEGSRMMFNALMKQAGLDPDPPQEPASPALLKVAQKYYMERVYEIHSLLKQASDQFQTCYHEIQDIKAGKWDHMVLPTGGDRTTADEKAQEAAMDLDDVAPQVAVDRLPPLPGFE